MALMQEVFDRQKAKKGQTAPGAACPEQPGRVPCFGRKAGQVARALRADADETTRETRRGPSRDTPCPGRRWARPTSMPARRSGAGAVLQGVFEKMEARLGADHPFTLKTMNDLGVALCDAGQPQKGLEMLEQAAEETDRQARSRSPGHVAQHDVRRGAVSDRPSGASGGAAAGGSAGRDNKSDSVRITRTLWSQCGAWPPPTTRRTNRIRRCRCSSGRWNCKRCDTVRTTRKLS